MSQSYSKPINRTPVEYVTDAITQSSATLALSRTREYFKIALNANVTAVTITGWPAAGTLGRLILEITNGGNFGITGWPPGVLWLNGIASLSTGAGVVDLVTLLSTDGGNTIIGSIGRGVAAAGTGGLSRGKVLALLAR